MRIIHALLQTLALRLDGRSRRVLLFASTGALAFFARATVSAAQAGAYADTAASGLMLAGAAVAAAVAWSAPRRAG